MKEHVSDDVSDDIKEELKQETAVAVLEAMMGFDSEADGVPSQSVLYSIVSEYLEGWLNAQICKECDENYLSLQEIMQSMYHTSDDDYQDVDDCCGRCDHTRKIINIYNANGGTINIML